MHYPYVVYLAAAVAETDAHIGPNVLPAPPCFFVQTVGFQCTVTGARNGARGLQAPA